MALVGCPFCREMFTEGEHEACPACGMALLPIEKLPPSYEERVARAAEIAATPPEDRLVAWWYFRRGRGALVLLSLAGLAAFFAPWVILQKPDDLVYSGYDLARARGSWFFGGAVGWFVMLPLVVTRRTVYKMRGVRVVTGMFAAMSVVVAAQLFLQPPRGSRYIPIAYEWGYGLYATLALGVLGVLAAARFGGSLDDIDVRELAPGNSPELSPDASPERTLH